MQDGNSALSMEEDGQKRLRVFLANCRLEHLTFALISADISSMEQLLSAAKELDEKLPPVGASQGDVQRLKAAVEEVVPESIKEFLAGAGLGSFQQNLMELGVETMEDLFDDHLVTEQSLALVGMPKPKARILLLQRRDLAERSPITSRRISVANTLNPSAAVPAASPPDSDQHVIRVKIPQGAPAGSILKVPVFVQGKKIIFSVTVPQDAHPGSEVSLRVRIPRDADGTGPFSPSSAGRGDGGPTRSAPPSGQVRRAASLSSPQPSRAAAPPSSLQHSASFTGAAAAEANDKPMTSLRAIRKSAARYTGMRGVFSGKFRSKSKEGSSDEDVRRVLFSVGLESCSPQFVEFGIRSIEDMIESEIVPDEELANEMGMSLGQVKGYREVVATAKQATARGEPWDSALPPPPAGPTPKPSGGGGGGGLSAPPTRAQEQSQAAKLQEFLLNTGVGHASLALSSMGIESLEAFSHILVNDDLCGLLINEVGLTFEDVQRCRSALDTFGVAQSQQPAVPPVAPVPNAAPTAPPGVLDGVPEDQEDDDPDFFPAQHVFRTQTMRLQDSPPSTGASGLTALGTRTRAEDGGPVSTPTPNPSPAAAAPALVSAPRGGGTVASGVDEGDGDMQHYANLIRATMRYHQAQEQTLGSPVITGGILEGDEATPGVH